MPTTAVAPAIDEASVVSILSVRPAWVPEIAQKTQASNVAIRNVISRMFERGDIDITRNGFILAVTK